MRAHKFQVGQSLAFSPTLYEKHGSDGFFEVTRLLPSEGTESMYRIKSVASGQERVVRESQLRLLTGRDALQARL
jgi:hypothetical protein